MKPAPAFCRAGQGGPCFAPECDCWRDAHPSTPATNGLTWLDIATEWAEETIEHGSSAYILPQTAEAVAQAFLALKSARSESGAIIDALGLRGLVAKRSGTSMAMCLDHDLPEGVVEVRDQVTGKVLGRIINVGS